MKPEKRLERKKRLLETEKRPSGNPDQMFIQLFSEGKTDENSKTTGVLKN